MPGDTLGDLTQHGGLFSEVQGDYDAVNIEVLGYVSS